MRAAGKGRVSAFSKDVAVNVLANLVAGAMIYLGGAVAGLFPRDPEAIVASVIALAFFVLVLLGVHPKGDREVANMVGGLAIFGAGGAFAAAGAWWKLPGIPSLPALVFGAFLLLQGFGLFSRALLRHRRDRREEGRIRGLHWIDTPSGSPEAG